MSTLHRLSVAALVAVAVVAAGCGDPPDREMQQAQGAIDAARAAGADAYAHEEFAAAEEALKQAHEAVGGRDYRLALNRALDSLERAQTAAKEAADNKAAARSDAERLLAGTSAALDQVKAKLKAAENARVPAKALAAARTAIAHGDARVQEARAVFAKGDYLAISQRLAGETERLRGVTQNLDAASGPPSRRRG